uniref:YgiQ family radical SAM protein n=1 Tax=Serpentinimonas barnesii TaxID=1458427 RepID=UPI00049846B1
MSSATYPDVSFFPRPAKPLPSFKPYWAKRLGVAPFLPTSRAEMERLGWDSCDVVLVTGDAYVDHPSFGMAVIGRVLEAQGFRVGIIAQPDWHSAEPFKVLGRPNLFWGVTSGNMDSMINRYTADRKIRSDDAYTPGNQGGKRPDRAAIVYSQRCREAFKEVPIVLGGIEGSLRRIAHYDYWSDQVRRSIVVDAKCDLLLYGNAERAIVEIAHRLARREPVQQITDVRGTAFVRRSSAPGWVELDSTEVDRPGRVQAHLSPYLSTSEQAQAQGASCSKEEASVSKEEASVRAEPVETLAPVRAEPVETPAPVRAEPVEALASPSILRQAQDGPSSGRTVQVQVKPIAFHPPLAQRAKAAAPERERTVIRLPSYEQVRADPVLYAHASRVLHLETNPGNARALVQAHGSGATAREVWINPPPIPLSSAEMDWVFDLPYARSPHPRYADEHGRHDGPTKIPAWEMIRFSVNIMRGCFGGCSFCSITEHEGRIIQSRSEDSIVREVEQIRDQVTGFTGVISDLGGPTANMYRLGCKSPEIEAAC